MKLVKDEFGIDCFKIKVNQVDDFSKRCGIETTDYLASEYGKDYYLLRNNGVFGCIVLKKDCSIL